MFGGVAAAGGLGAPFTQGMNALSDSLVYMGVTIVKSNHIPNKDYATVDTNSIGEARYDVTGQVSTAAAKATVGAGVRALIWMPECVASLRKTGLVVDTVDDVRRNTTFTVASMLSGTGILKPELAKVVVNSKANVGGTPADILFDAVGAPTRLEVLAKLGGVANFGYANA